MDRNFLPDWKRRGLVRDTTGDAELGEHLNGGSRTLYAGFDATGNSLHVGHLLPLLALRRAQRAGHRPIVLIGGGTGMIGDPSGKEHERTLNAPETVAEWAAQLREQVSRIVDLDAGSCSALVLNNADWIGKLGVVEFLRDIGKHFAVSAMLAKDSVRTRLNREGEGISFTEFSYMILQSYDFLHLHRNYGCTVQLGGSDQWGNITAGIDLIRRVGERAEVHGLTLQLVTKADGTMFAKSEGDAVWLDGSKTSPYEFYQFWINQDDADAERYLHYFTFLSAQEIADLARAISERPEAREAQRTLAREVTRTVHGESGLDQAKKITDALFTGSIRSLSRKELEVALKGAPSTTLPRPPESVGIIDLLLITGLASGKGRARELIRSGAVQVNGERITDAATTFSPAQSLHDRYLVIRKGKKTYHVVTLTEAAPDK